MKIALVQIRSAKGDIDENLIKHLRFANLAADAGASVVVFPELSLTGYEPTRAKDLAFERSDDRFSPLMSCAVDRRILLMVGAPVVTKNLPHIGMAIIDPEHPIQFYCKQHLHPDEIPFFSPGVQSITLSREGERLFPAICYESLLDVHVERAIAERASAYLASVAKSQRGVENAHIFFAAISAKYRIPVLLVNGVGFNDNFVSSGQSAAWTGQGRLSQALGSTEEGILLYDTKGECASIISL